MSSANDGALFVGFLALLGVLLAPIINHLFTLNENQKVRRHEYIDDIVKRLQVVRGEIQSVQYTEWELFDGKKSFDDLKATPDFQKLQAAYATAYAIMISTDIKDIQEKANDIMDLSNQDPKKKNDSVDFALKKLGQEYNIFRKDIPAQIS